MSGITRRLLNLMTLLSLLLLVAVAALWGWTREHHAVAWRGRGGTFDHLWVFHDGVRLTRVPATGAAPPRAAAPTAAPPAATTSAPPRADARSAEQQRGRRKATRRGGNSCPLSLVLRGEGRGEGLLGKG